MSLNGRLENCKIGGCKEIRQPFANPSPTPCQPFANLSPTLCQPFCQPLSKPLFPWTPGTRLETWANGFLVKERACQNAVYLAAICDLELGLGATTRCRCPTMEPFFVKKNTAISRLLPLEFWCPEGHFTQFHLILTLFWLILTCFDLFPRAI